MAPNKGGIASLGMPTEARRHELRKKDLEHPALPNRLGLHDHLGVTGREGGAHLGGRGLVRKLGPFTLLA